MKDFAVQVTSGPSSGKRYQARQGILTVGRVRGNDLVLEDPGVSRQHLRLHSRGTDVLAEDLDSANGTYVEGQRVRRAALRGGERIRLGGTTLQLEGGRARGRTDLRPAIVAAACVLTVSLAVLARPGAPDPARSEVGAVRLSFPAPSQPSLLLLRYQCLRAEKDGLVEVRVDGTPVGLVPRVDGSARSVELVLAASSLGPGSGHEVSFLAHGEGAWEVGSVAVVAEPLPGCAPAACLAQAASTEERGKSRLEARFVTAGNLFDAWIQLRRARLLLAGVHARPALAAENEELLQGASASLDALCAKLRFSATRDLALGNAEGAAAAARAILSEFPSDEHPCRGAALHMLEVLGVAP